MSTDTATERFDNSPYNQCTHINRVYDEHDCSMGNAQQADGAHTGQRKERFSGGQADPSDSQCTKAPRRSCPHTFRKRIFLASWKCFIIDTHLHTDRKQRRSGSGGFHSRLWRSMLPAEIAVQA